MLAYILRNEYDDLHLLCDEPRIDTSPFESPLLVHNGLKALIYPTKEEKQVLLDAIPQNEFRRVEISVLPDTEEYLTERAERWAKQRLEEAEFNWEGEEDGH